MAPRHLGVRIAAAALLLIVSSACSDPTPRASATLPTAAEQQTPADTEFDVQDSMAATARAPSTARTQEAQPLSWGAFQCVGADGRVVPGLVVTVRGSDGRVLLTNGDGMGVVRFDPDWRTLQPMDVEASWVGGGGHAQTIDLGRGAKGDPNAQFELPPCGALEFVFPADAKTGEYTIEMPGFDETPLPLYWEKGVLRLEPVHLGHTFALVGPEGVRMRPSQFEGPQADGESVRVELHPRSLGSWFNARIALSDGRPPVGARIRAEIFVNGRKAAPTARARVDASGEIELELRWNAPPPEFELSLSTMGRPVHQTERARFRVAAIQPGANDLGVLRLEQPPLLLAGRVVDAQGRGIEGAAVGLEPRPALRMGETMVPFEVVGTDPLGRFEMRGDPPLFDVALVARAPGHGPAWIERAPLGALDVELALGAGASVSGVLRAPSGAGRDSADVPVVLRLEVRSADPAAAPHTILMLGNGATPFRIDGARAGPSSLFVLDHGRLAHWRIADFEVPHEGGIDLGDVEWSSAVETVMVQLVERSTAASNASIRPVDGGFIAPPSGAGGMQSDGAVVRVQVPPEGLDVVAGARLFLDTPLRLVAPGPIVVALERAPRLELELPAELGGAYDVGTGFDFGVRLQPAAAKGAAQRTADREPHWFEGERRLVLFPRFKGPARAEVWLARVTSTERRVVLVGEVALDVDSATRLLPIDAQALDAARALLEVD